MDRDRPGDVWSVPGLADLPKEADVPHVKRSRSQPVAFGNILGTYVEEPTPADPHHEALLRLARMPGIPKLHVTHALSVFNDLDLPVPTEILNRMIDVAERKYAEGHYSVDERERHPRAHEPVVYYLRLDRLVKIGTSGNLFTRLRALSFDTLLAVEWGGHTLETRRHHQFAELRHVDEWFRLDGPLVEHVDVVRAEFEASVGMDTETWVHERLAL